MKKIKMKKVLLTCILLFWIPLTLGAIKRVPRVIKFTHLEKFAIQVVKNTVYVRDAETNLVFAVSDITPPRSLDRRYAVNVFGSHRIVNIPEDKLIVLEKE